MTPIVTQQPPIAERVGTLPSPAVAVMLEQARALRERGVALTSLVRGEPDFDTPENIRQAAAAALERGETHYPPLRGIPELQEAIAEKLVRENGIEADPATEVLVTTGATLGLYLALMAITNPGGEVLIPDPIYDAYRGIIHMAGAIPVTVPVEREGGHFIIPAAAVEARVSERTSALLLNTPWNPTGTVMREEELQALAEVAERHRLFVIMDEVYESLVFDGHRHLSFAALYETLKARTITVNSFSKTYAMTGWRLGYNIASPEVTRAMLQLLQQSSRGPATFIQWAGVEALRGPQDAAREMTREYARRRALMAEKLSQIEGLRFHLPEGTFFAFVDMSVYAVDSYRLANHFLEAGHVITVPGEVYGEGGRGHIRLSFAVGEEAITTGIERIRESLATL